VVVKEARPIVCYKCGIVLGKTKAEWTQPGMARFREKAAALKRDHVCQPQNTRQDAR